VSGRSGLVALAGRPNVGKSTLANALAGRHVAAVSPRPQTSRRRISAVVHGEDWQAVLLDLPGFQRPADELTSRMQATVDQTLVDADAALFVVNATEPSGPGDRFIAERLRAARRPAIAVVNQVDRADPGRIAEAIAATAALLGDDLIALHPVSALNGDGLEALREDLPQLLLEGPAFFPPGVATDQTEEELAAELIREAALVRLRQELPHALAVDVTEIADARAGGLVVRAGLVVETESQKGIVVGRGGSMVRAIGAAARATLARAWGTEVHLDLTVRVRKHWRDDPAMLKRLGL
jgi:GTP-binding protein Era